MINGIGMDLIELNRIEKSMENPRFAARILTEMEREAFHKLKKRRRKTEYLAGRFAAKEAFAKACGTGIGKLSFQHIEILNEENGAPVLRAAGYEQYSIFISITHSRDYAAAQVVLAERKTREKDSLA